MTDGFACYVAGAHEDVFLSFGVLDIVPKRIKPPEGKTANSSCIARPSIAEGYRWQRIKIVHCAQEHRSRVFRLVLLHLIDYAVGALSSVLLAGELFAILYVSSEEFFWDPHVVFSRHARHRYQNFD